MENGIHGIHYFIQPICSLFYTDVKMKNSWADLCLSRSSKSVFCLGGVYKTISACFDKNKSLNMYMWSGRSDMIMKDPLQSRIKGCP